MRLHHLDWVARAQQATQELAMEELLEAGIVPRGEPFVPVITYPAMGLMPSAHADEVLGAHPAVRQPVALYLHLPFCLTRCHFCHWVTRVGSTEDEVAGYLDGLDLELRLYRERLSLDRIRVASILVGGGTPSCLSAANLQKFLHLLDKHVDTTECRQFSFEAEPSTLLGDSGAELLRILRDHGVHRLSMGVQAFDDGLLRQTARPHSSAQALEAIARIREFGFQSVAIDLIYGLGGQTLQQWIDTMQTAVRSGADSWQLYRLRIAPHGDRPGTVLGHYRQDPSTFPGYDEGSVMKMLGILISEEHGFHQDYTRIFSRDPSHVSGYLHDVNNDLADVIPAGISSWGSLDSTYFLHVGDDFRKYRQMLAEGRLPIDRGLVLDEATAQRRALILPLKNTRVDKQAYFDRMGRWPQDLFAPTLERLRGLDLVEEDQDFLRLTARGRFFADEVVMQFFEPRFVPPRKLA